METLILHRFQIRAQKKLRGFRSRACHRDYFLNSTVDFTFNKEISMETNPAGTPGYRNGTESFFGLKGRPSVVRDVEIHNQPVLRKRRK